MNDSKLNSDSLASSGMEVESLTTKGAMPIAEAEEKPHGDVLGSRVKPQFHRVQTALRGRVARVQPLLHDRMTQLQASGRTQVTSFRRLMREKPMLLTGLATAAGLAIGLAGRIARHRMARSRMRTVDAVEVEYYC